MPPARVFHRIMPKFPSRSAPVGRLLGRANQLGEHAVLYSTMPAPPGNDRPQRGRPLNRDRIDLNEFKRKSDLIDPSEFLNMDIDSCIDSFCNSMYDAARESPVTYLCTRVGRSYWSHRSVICIGQTVECQQKPRHRWPSTWFIQTSSSTMDSYLDCYIKQYLYTGLPRQMGL